MFSRNRNEKSKSFIDLKEKEILFFTGRKRSRTIRKHLRLVRTYEEPQ